MAAVACVRRGGDTVLGRRSKSGPSERVECVAFLLEQDRFPEDLRFLHEAKAPNDRKVRIFELIEFDDAVKGYLLASVDRIAREAVEEMRQTYDRRRRLIVDGFNDIGLKCFEPRGAFYAFPNISASGLDTPIPFSPPLEDAYRPDAEKIYRAAQDLVVWGRILYIS